MKNGDTFFSQAPDAGLNEKVLHLAEAELSLIRASKKRRRFLVWLAPLTAAVCAGFFAFKFVTNKESELLAANSDQIDLISDLVEDEDALDIISNLNLLEDLELIEQLEIEDA